MISFFQISVYTMEWIVRGFSIFKAKKKGEKRTVIGCLQHSVASKVLLLYWQRIVFSSNFYILAEKFNSLDAMAHGKLPNAVADLLCSMFVCSVLHDHSDTIWIGTEIQYFSIILFAREMWAIIPKRKATDRNQNSRSKIS